MSENFYAALERLNQEALLPPEDAELHCRLESISGDIAKVIVEPADGRIIVADFPAHLVVDKDIREGEYFSYRRSGEPRINRIVFEASTDEKIRTTIEQVRESVQNDFEL